jgi:hypothetical protein
MRRVSRVTLLLLPSLLFSVCAWADEAADRSAIDRTLTGLDRFTSDSDASPVLDRLRKLKGWSVTISHEPLGEATINRPTPRIVSGGVRFITVDVALVEGTCSYEDGTTMPLLFVMKKEGDDWKIASLRVLETVRN